MPLKRPGPAIVFLVLALTALLWLLSKRSLVVFDGNADAFVALAQITALMGTVIFAVSFAIASRVYLVEEAFGGLDRAYRWHHRYGVWAFSLLVIHFVSVFIGYGLNGVDLWSFPFSSVIYIAGEIGLLVMAAIILVIIYAKLKYQTFVFLQKFFILGFGFGAYHLLFVFSDVSRYWPLRWFMIFFVVLGAVAWIYREFFYRFLGPHAAYTVKRVEMKGPDVVEITLSPKNQPLKAKPGQFAYFSFRSANVTAELHPFSFTSAPDEPDLRFAAKALGDYTKTLNRAEVGDEVIVYGPYGRFFVGFNPNAENVFIAGGIGVTPFLSVLRDQRACVKTTTFYTTRSESDSVYAAELDQLSCGPASFKYFFHESERRGYLTADIIEKRAGDLRAKTIYLCGPGPMMAGLAKGFLAKGVPKSRIVFESFSY